MVSMDKVLNFVAVDFETMTAERIRAKTAVFVVVLFIVTFAVKNGKGYV